SLSATAPPRPHHAAGLITPSASSRPRPHHALDLITPSASSRPRPHHALDLITPSASSRRPAAASPAGRTAARCVVRRVARLSRTTFPATPCCAPATGPHISRSPCLPPPRSA